jgi:hypothetical protein
MDAKQHQTDSGAYTASTQEVFAPYDLDAVRPVHVSRMKTTFAAGGRREKQLAPVGMSRRPAREERVIECRFIQRRRK